MSEAGDLLEETAEELFEEAPCGYLTTALDGTILRVNRTFETLTGHDRSHLIGQRTFQQLLSAGGRIYHETHVAPLLRMQGSVSEIALEVVRADGSRVPVLVNAALRSDDGGRPRAIRTTVFDARDRRRYERELLAARRREQEIARDLQRSLLAGAAPEAPGLTVEVAYRPAVAGLEVGGDWYDAFWLDPPRTIGLVVGDVVGRGLAAAATMGQLRSAVRALASTGLAPGELLHALDRYARRHEVGQMATVVYADLDLERGRLRYACAGHPPPLVLEAGAEGRFLLEGRSLPLDALAAPTARTGATAELPPGAVLLLYTDGLIERSDRPLQAGMERLRAEVERHRTDDPAVLPAALVNALTAEAPKADDVCLLAIGRTAGPRA